MQHEVIMPYVTSERLEQLGQKCSLTMTSLSLHQPKHLSFTSLWPNLADNKLMIFFLFFPEDRIWYFKQIICIGDNLHAMVKTCFLGKMRKSILVCCLQEILPWVLSNNSISDYDLQSSYLPPTWSLTGTQTMVSHFTLQSTDFVILHMNHVIIPTANCVYWREGAGILFSRCLSACMSVRSFIHYVLVSASYLAKWFIRRQS